MNTKARTTILCLAIAGAALAAKSSIPKRITPQRIAELTAPADAPKAKTYTVEIFGLEGPGPGTGGVDKNFRPAPKPVLSKIDPARVTLAAENPEGGFEMTREVAFPSEFEPPHAAPGGEMLSPAAPKAFDRVKAGWTFHLSAKPAGKYVALSGTADCVEVELLNGGYGELARPIYSEKGAFISPNVFHQPKIKSTSTRFYIFAVPGEPYQVTLYRGDKEEKVTVQVIAG